MEGLRQTVKCAHGEEDNCRVSSLVQRTDCVEKCRGRLATVAGLGAGLVSAVLRTDGSTAKSQSRELSRGLMGSPM